MKWMRWNKNHNEKIENRIRLSFLCSAIVSTNFSFVFISFIGICATVSVTVCIHYTVHKLNIYFLFCFRLCIFFFSQKLTCSKIMAPGYSCARPDCLRGHAKIHVPEIKSINFLKQPKCSNNNKPIAIDRSSSSVSSCQ